MRYTISDTEIFHPERGNDIYFYTLVTIGKRKFEISQYAEKLSDFAKNSIRVRTWTNKKPKPMDRGGMGKVFWSLEEVTSHYKLLTIEILEEVVMQHFEAFNQSTRYSGSEAPDMDIRGRGRMSEKKTLLEQYNESKKSSNIWESYDKSVMGIHANYQNKMMDSYIESAINDNLGYKREENAQINDVEYTKTHLMDNWNAKKRRMKIGSLKASQNEYSKEKVEGMMVAEEFDPFKTTYFVSEDKRLLDGHHSWIYGMSVDENQYVDVIKVPLTFNKTKKILHHLKNTDRKAVTERKKVNFEKWLGDDIYKLTKGIENSIDEDELFNHLIKYAKEVGNVKRNITVEAEYFMDTEYREEEINFMVDDETGTNLITYFEIDIDSLEELSNDFLDFLSRINEGIDSKFEEYLKNNYNSKRKAVSEKKK